METHIPEYMLSAFAAEGIDTSKLIYATHTDSADKDWYSDVYIAVSSENMYILYGEEKVVKTTGARRIVAVYDAKELEIHPLPELGELTCERLLSTARLCSGKDDKTSILLVFSIGYLSDIERLIKVIQNIREGKKPLGDILIDEELFCPKCGTRYPEPERKLCPKCMDKVSITRRLMGFFVHYRSKVAVIFLAMLAGSVFSMISPLIGTKFFFDEVLIEGGSYYGAILQAVCLIFIVRAIGVALNIFYSYVLAKTVPWIVQDLKLKIFEAMQRLSVGFYTSKRTGSLMNRINQQHLLVFC